VKGGEDLGQERLDLGLEEAKESWDEMMAGFWGWKHRIWGWGGKRRGGMEGGEDLGMETSDLVLEGGKGEVG